MKRGSALQRRTPLARGSTPLRRAPLTGGRLRRSTPLRWKPSAEELRFWKERRAEVIARDGGRCVDCGKPSRSACHRIALGRTATRYRPHPLNELWNLRLLCDGPGSCHEAEETGRNAATRPRRGLDELALRRGAIAMRLLPDGRVLDVQELTFNRARLVLSADLEAACYLDGW